MMGQKGTDKRKKNITELVTGEMQFSGDLCNEINFLYIYPFVSHCASGKLISIDFDEAAKVEGYIYGYTAKDIPGVNAIGAISRREEPLFATDSIHYVGQPIGFVIAETLKKARKAARLVKVEIEEDDKAVLSIEEAINKKSYYAKPIIVASGDIDKGFRESDHILEGKFISGGQEHAYIETQRAFASYTPFKRSVLIHCGTQGITDVQEVVALLLGRSVNDVEVDVYRVGGAFGGKERGGTMWSAMAALGLEKTGRSCALILDRSDDLVWTGKRHPYMSMYKVGCNNEGKITALDIKMYADGGYYEDFTEAIMERSVLGVCGCYYLSNSNIVGYCCKTNVPANTAFRGFGAPQATLAMEDIIYQISKKVNMSINEVQRENFFKESQLAPYGMTMTEVAIPQIYEELLKSVDYSALEKEVATYNDTHCSSKKGIGIVPVKYGIGFTATFLNQGNALVYVYTDGSISVSHGGIEMGQGLFTKVELIVAKTLGVDPNRVTCESTNSLRAGSVASTAASTGTDINGEAARLAALEVRESMTKGASQFLEEKYELAPAENYIVFEDDLWWDKRMPEVKESFESLASFCYFQRYKMGAQAHYATPGLKYDIEKGKGNPFAYFTNGVCLSVVTIDTLTGSYTLDKVAIRHEGGNIIDYDIDRGQLVGGFVQGYGFVTMEELPHATDGRQLASSFSTYKVPLITDVPDDFTVDLMPSKNEVCGVLGSKGVGEPPLIYGVSVFNALRDAIGSVYPDKVIYLQHPATPMEVLLNVTELNNN